MLGCYSMLCVVLLGFEGSVLLGRLGVAVVCRFKRVVCGCLWLLDLPCQLHCVATSTPLPFQANQIQSYVTLIIG